ncbi:ankyrin repeat domain-containing protein [Aspergillus mulundensis]|uniref:Uncharacterized protein n=1 Tax=Aspergillus mulundensis TaxID=1810919 RepID=A0A3D8SD32_9EURO|nr:hypothetical protein DSM5745_03994 [Aspergillus mulundensis]RDW83668.1 hypothetical protein DSM5745_03994 [Aspergillus mulundensis]
MVTKLPLEIQLEIAEYLMPEYQLCYLRAFPHLARLFGPRQFKPKGEFMDNILHTITALGGEDMHRRYHWSNIKRQLELRPRLALDTAIFTDLIACKSANLHIQNKFNDTPLMNAISASSLTFAKLILDKDPSGINLTDQEGRAALHRAVEAESTAGLALLLAQPGVDPNMVMDKYRNRTPLIQCLWRYFYKGAELLIAHRNIDLNHAAGDGDTALIMAARHGQDDLVRRILDRADVKVNVNDEGNKGYTALDHAIVGNHAGIVDMLLGTDGIRPRWDSRDGDDWRRNPLYVAARAGAVNALERLLKCEHARVHATNFSGRDLAYYDIRNPRCRRLLLDHGALPIDSGQDEQT